MIVKFINCLSILHYDQSIIIQSGVLILLYFDHLQNTFYPFNHLLNRLNILQILSIILELIWNYQSANHINYNHPQPIMRIINRSLSSFSQYPKNADLSSSNTFYVPVLLSPVQRSRQKNHTPKVNTRL